MDQFRRPEWWIHPVEFEELKRGDCEDHALWAWRVLHDMGHDVRLMLGLCRGVGHAWVQLYVDEESYVLEATAKHDVPASNASDYVPEHSFRRMDNGSFVMFGHKPQVIDAAKRTPTSPLTLRGPDRQRLRRQDDPAESTSADPLTLREHWVEIDRLIFAGKKTEAHRAIRIAVQGKGSYTRQFLDRYFYLREQQPDSFELDDEAYWEDWKV